MKRIIFSLMAATPLFAQQPPAASDPVPAPPPFGFPGGVPPQVQIQRVAPDESSGASAQFAAGARVGRPVEFRVTVFGLPRLVEHPPLPEVAGLKFQPAGRTIIAGGGAIFRYDMIAERAGAFTVPSFEIAVADRHITVPQTHLVVNEAQPGESRYMPVQASIDIPKRDFYVGETFAGRLLFTETDDESPSYIQHVAKTNGSAVFKVENMIRSAEVVVNGVKRRAIAKPIQITPMREGENEISCQVVVHVQKRDGISMRQNGFAMQVQSTIDVPAVKLKVLPLPTEGRTPGFTGAIGEFTLSAPKLSGTEVQVGEPITLAISLTGEGNLAGVSAPELPKDNADWQTYKPTTDLDSPNDEATPLLATKTFTYTLVPKRDGVRATPAIPFSYFDPAKAKFVDVTIPPQPVKVTPAPESAAPATAETTAEKAAEATETKGPKTPEPALTGLAEATGMWSRSLTPALWSVGFLAAQLAPLLTLLGIWAWRRRSEYLAAYPQIIRRRKARAAARLALAEARAAARSGDQTAFLAASTRAIREAAAPLDSAQAASLTAEEVLHILRDDERASKTARALFENAEASRYGASEPVKPKSLIPDLEHTLARLSAKA